MDPRPVWESPTKVREGVGVSQVSEAMQKNKAAQRSFIAGRLCLGGTDRTGECPVRYE
jgi:hypothetical protein